MPRQMPSSGTPWAIAAWMSALSQVSRSRAGGPVRGSGAAPYRTGSTSAPPAITRASSRDTVWAAYSAASGGSRKAAAPARWTWV
ncbi:hypothetical protein BB341_23775 [Streptomyces clavuligerus]|nr:hypothetical protein BB341_23775 [Streptomyces clavuligerus]